MMGCVMLSKVFKVSLLGAAVFWGQHAYAFIPGIPVYCGNCQEASSNAAHSILDGIRSQTEALLNAQDYAVKSKSKVDLAQGTAILKAERAIKNAEAFDPELSKPDTACATYEAANLRNATAGEVTGAVKDAIVKTARDHNMSASKLSETEPKREYFVKSVLDRMHPDKEEDAETSAKVILSEPIPESALAKFLEKIVFLTNPFPVETPTAEALDKIKAKGSTGDQDAMARVLVANDRLARSQVILTSEATRDAQLYDASVLDKYLKQIRSTGTAEQKKLLKGKLSANQIDELLATYRVRSPSWVAESMKGKEIKLYREQTLIQAEMLNQLWQIKDLMRSMKKMQAWTDAQETVQSGVSKQ